LLINSAGNHHLPVFFNDISKYLYSFDFLEDVIILHNVVCDFSSKILQTMQPIFILTRIFI